MRYANVNEAVERLRRHGVDVSAKLVTVSVPIGIRLWGAVDFLCQNGRQLIINLTPTGDGSES